MSPGSREEASSRSLLLGAVTATLLVTAIGSWVIWSAYANTYVPNAPRSEEALHATGDPLVVCVGRTPGGPAEWSAYVLAFARLERDLGRPVVLRYVLNRSDAAALIERRQADVALVSIAVYFDLRGKGAARLVAVPVLSGHARDSAVLVVSAAGNRSRLADLRGTTFAAMPSSLAGSTYTYWLLNRSGEEPTRFFGRVETGVTQQANLMSVATGSATATSVNRSALEAWPAGTFRVIEESPEFGPPPIVARSGLSDAEVDAIRRSLVALRPDELKTSTGSLDGFALVADRDYGFPEILSAFARRADLGPGE